MMFQISTESFRMVLCAAFSACKSIGYLRLVADMGGRLHVTGTDLDIAVRASTDAYVGKAGEILAPARALVDLVAAMTNENVLVEVPFDEEILVYTCDDLALYTLPGRPCEQFPDPFTRIFSPYAECSRSDLASIDHRVSPVVSVDPARQILHGVYLEAGDQEITAVATDGKRLSSLTIPVSWMPHRGKGMILRPSALAAMASWSDADRILVSVQSKDDIPQEVLFEPARAPEDAQAGLSIQVWCHLIPGPYPRWREVVRSASATEVHVSRAEIVSALARLHALRPASAKALGIQTRVVAAGVELLSILPDGEPSGSEIVRQLSETGPEWDPTIEIDAILLHHALQLVPGSEVILGLSSPREAVHITMVDPDAYRPLVMVMPLTPRKEA
jgi:hypothetical protein